MAKLSPWDPRKHGGWTRAAALSAAATLLLLWLTGIVLYAWPGADAAALEPWEASLRHWAAVLHGGIVWVLLVFAGRWIWPHVTGIWRKPKTVTWFIGFAMLGTLVVATCTGLFLLYGPAGSHDAVASGHWWNAVAVPAVAAWHAKGLLCSNPESSFDDNDRS